MSEHKTKRGIPGYVLVLGLLFGIVVGIALALLFAPQRGEETREQLSDRAETVRRSYKDIFELGRQAYLSGREEVLARMR